MMGHTNGIYQIFLVLFFLSFSMYYLVVGIKRKDKKRLAGSAFCLSFAISSLTRLLGNLDLFLPFRGDLKSIGLVALVLSLVYGSIIVKEWRKQILGVCIGVFTIMVLVYFQVHQRSKSTRNTASELAGVTSNASSMD